VLTFPLRRNRATDGFVSSYLMMNDDTTDRWLRALFSGDVMVGELERRRAQEEAEVGRES
jgi:hypothetical protein